MKDFCRIAALGLLLWGSAPGASAIDWLQSDERALWGSICSTQNATTTNYKSTLDRMLLTWRMLPGDSEDTAFDLYRTVDGGTETKVNKSPIYATNYQDTGVGRTKAVSYRLTLAGDDTTIGGYTVSAEQIKGGLPYISIPLSETASVCSIDGMSYQANDVSVGDLDGDGKMEIVVKRLLAHGDNDGTGSGESPLEVRHPVLYEAYRLDGTMLWRVCSGPSIILGNSSSFAVADFDGDGKAEVALKTGEGTVFGDGIEIGDTDGDGRTDYRTAGANYISSGPEFFSVIDGETGRELARADFIKRGKSEDWGDNYYKRAYSLRVGVAYVDGELPGIVLGRGVYARSVLEAWDWRGGELTRRWHFDTSAAGSGKDGKAHSKYAAQGYHSLSTGDVDGDGCDEIVYGSMTVDHDGGGLYTSELGHGDALHLGKFVPGREGLQVFSCFETGKTMVALRDAADGSVIWKKLDTKEGDMGRCMIDDIDPASPGCEMWWYKGNALTTEGGDLGYYPGSTNFAIWFDGSLSRQVMTGTKIDSKPSGRVFTVYRYDVSHINGTKENPSFYGDILGDWREEVIFPDATKTKDLKIFSTWIPTAHRMPWLMTDHVYHMSALNQNIGYNQPTHTGYYLGSDLKSDREAWDAAGYSRYNSVDAIGCGGADDGAWYDLHGRRVDPARLGRGVYVHRGRKYVF